MRSAKGQGLGYQACLLSARGLGYRAYRVKLAVATGHERVQGSARAASPQTLNLKYKSMPLNPAILLRLEITLLGNYVPIPVSRSSGP